MKEAIVGLQVWCLARGGVTAQTKKGTSLSVEKRDLDVFGRRKVRE